MVKFLVALFVLLVLAGAGTVIYLGQGPAAPGETYVVTVGSVHRAVRGSGRAEGAADTPLSFGMAGRVDSVAVKEGQEVVVNDILAEINDSEVKKQIEQVQAAVNEAEAELDFAKVPPAPAAIQQAEEKYEQAKLAVKAAESKLRVLRQPPPTPKAPDWQQADAERAVQDAQSNLELAQLDLKKLKEGANTDDVEIAKRKWEAAMADRDSQQKRLDKFKEGAPISLLGSGSPRETKADVEAALARAEEQIKVTSAEYDRARRPRAPEEIRAGELKVALTQNALDKAKADLGRLKNPPPPLPTPAHDIEQAELALQQAQALERKEKAALDDAKRPPDANKIRVAEASLARKKAELSGLKLRMEGLKLRAPADGQVKKRHVEPGATVNAFVPIVTLVDFSQKRIRAEYDVSRMSEIKPGMPVTITSRAFNKESLEGKVLELGRIGGRKMFSEDPAAPKGGEIVEVVIAVDEPKNALKKEIYSKVLRLELPVETEVTLERRDKVLVVPKSFVSQEDGQSFVLRLNRDLASGKTEAPKRYPIKTGLYDEHFVEIVSGLGEGDTVMKPKAANTR